MPKRILVLAALLAAVLAAAWLGLHGSIDREQLREAVTAAGPFGPLLFVALFSALQALGVPGLVFIGVAIVVWPPWQALLLVWAGAVGAACVGFAFARTIGRRFVAAHLSERFRSFDARLATSGLRYVIAVRLLFYLATPAHWLIGLSGVPFWTAFAGSLIGFLPPTALWTLVGGSFFDWISRQSPQTWTTVAVLVALIVVGRLLWRRRRGLVSLRPTE